MSSKLPYMCDHPVCCTLHSTCRRFFRWLMFCRPHIRFHRLHNQSFPTRIQHGIWCTVGYCCLCRTHSWKSKLCMCFVRRNCPICMRNKRKVRSIPDTEKGKKNMSFERIGRNLNCKMCRLLGRCMSNTLSDMLCTYLWSCHSSFLQNNSLKTELMCSMAEGKW